MCAVAFRTTHGQNNTCKCDTEGFVRVASLNGMVRLPPLFIRSLIDSTVKYDLSYTLIKNEYTLPKILHVP